MTEADSHARRIVEELCAAAGRARDEGLVARLLAGEAMAVDERPVRLVREKTDPDHFHVCIDLGAPTDSRPYERMLKINFELAAGRLNVGERRRDRRLVFRQQERDMPDNTHLSSRIRS
jgi:hypothetical protein